MNHYMNLQMFAAEDAPNEEQADPSEEQADPGEGSTASGTDDPSSEYSDVKKYTDEDVNKLIERKHAEWQKRHEKQEAENSGDKKYTDDDVNKIIERKFAEWYKKQDKRQEAAEQEDPEVKKLREELASLRQKEARSDMMKTARATLADRNIVVSDDLIGMIVSEDEETTNANVNEFADMFKNEVSKAVKDTLKGTTPKTGGTSHLTKEQIMNVKSTAERQKLIKDNMYLFF